MNIGNLNFNFPQSISIGIQQNDQTPIPAKAAPESSSSVSTADVADISLSASRSKAKPKQTAPASAKPESQSPQKAAPLDPAPDIVVMKENGLETLVSMIDNAKESIDLHIYIITANTPELMTAFHNALDRGVKVRLMVEDDPFYWTQQKANPSEKAIEELVAAGAEYKPDNPVFSKSRVTHEKSMVFDGEKALILTGNLGSSTFKKNLDLGAIMIENPKVVNQIQTIFNSDWERVELPDMGETNLVISPDNARDKLTGLIGNAKQSIHVLQQGFTDKGVIDLLAQKLSEGVKTELTLTDPGIAQGNMQNAAYLALKGADVSFLVTPYIHAKAVNIDEGTKESKTYIGSQNFSMSAIDKNRELGYIFHDEKEQLAGVIDRYRDKGFAIPSKMVISDPSAIGSAVKGAIRTAEKEVIIQTNLFSDGGTKNALKKAAKDGVEVTVMMPQNPFPWDPNCVINIDTAKELEEAGVKVQMTDSTYKSMQGTCVLVDGKESITFPDNLSGSAFKYNNSYGVINISEKDVKEIETMLRADAEKTSASGKAAELSPTSEVVASPGNARQQLTSLLNSAEKSIKITTKELTDRKMAEIIKAKAKQGIPVHIILGPRKLKPQDAAMIEDLKASGANVAQMKIDSLSNNYIEIDQEKAYVGSHSLSRQSMDETRGFGNMVTHEEMLRIARGKFSEHWQKAGIQDAQQEITIDRASIDGDRELGELLQETGKRGIKVKLTCNNFEDSTTKVEFASLNSQIRTMAAMDPTVEENKETISKFFGEFFDIEKGLACQKKVAAILSQLKPGEDIFQGASSAEPIKASKITIDGKELKLLRSRDEEIAEMAAKQ